MSVTTFLDEQGRVFWQKRKPAYLQIHDLARYEQDTEVTADGAGTVSERIVLPAQSVSCFQLVPTR